MHLEFPPVSGQGHAIMKFGIFLPVVRNGFTASTTAPQYDPTFQHNLNICTLAEGFGMDFGLAMIKYRGFGGDTGFWDGCLDSITTITALAASTTTLKYFPSTSVLSIHPAVMARMMVLLDQVSGGRCGLNIVTGWNRPEYAQMGMWPGDEWFGKRYDVASEYVTALKLLWETGRATLDGDFFKLDDCTVLPKPQSKIPIVCAGASPRGYEFTAQHGDFAFTAGSVAQLKSAVDQLADLSKIHERKVGVYAQFALVIADTDAEARRIAEDIDDGADDAAMSNMMASASQDSNKDGSSRRLAQRARLPLERGGRAFMSPVIYGSPQTVASKIQDIGAESGIDGMMFAWPDYIRGVRAFGEKVMPKLRLPVAAA
jgi:pyrimidine oxygenase